MLISLTMSSAREHQNFAFIRFIAQLDLARFVFYNYTWDLTSPDYSTYNGHVVPARIPLSAIIAGTFLPLVSGFCSRTPRRPDGGRRNVLRRRRRAEGRFAG